MKVTGVIVISDTVNTQEAVFDVHCEGKRTKDCGDFVLVGEGVYEPLTRPLYEGFGQRA